MAHKALDQQNSNTNNGLFLLSSPPSSAFSVVPLKETGDQSDDDNYSSTSSRPRSSLQGSGSLVRNRARTLPIDGPVDRLCVKHGGQPWLKEELPTSLVGLHREMIDFYEWIKPTPLERRLRERVFNRLRSVVKGLWPNAKVEYFGSFRTGLFLPTSDIDVVVMANWTCPPYLALAEELKRSGMVIDSGIKVLDRAAVPIVKLVDKDTDIRIDISFNVKYGIQAAELVNNFIRDFPVLRYLVFTLKQFLLQRDMNEVFTGGVSSYSLILMIISYLQLHHPYLYRVPIDNVNLGVLLIGFFELYGHQFNYLNTALRIRDGGAYLLKDDVQKQMTGGHRPSMLCIEDPLQIDNDIGRGSHGAIYVKRAFEAAIYCLSPILCSRPDQRLYSEHGSVLSRIIRVTDDVIDYRCWMIELSTGFGNDGINDRPLVPSYAVVAGRPPPIATFPPSENASSLSDLSTDEDDTDDSLTRSRSNYSDIAQNAAPATPYRQPSRRVASESQYRGFWQAGGNSYQHQQQQQQRSRVFRSSHKKVPCA